MIYIFAFHSSSYFDNFLPTITQRSTSSREVINVNVCYSVCLSTKAITCEFHESRDCARGRLLGEIGQLKFCERVVKTCVLHFQLLFGTSSVSLTIIIFNESTVYYETSTAYKEMYHSIQKIYYT